jgi:hypothetical protein
MAEELPFLSRWSRRKVEAKQGVTPEPEEVPAPVALPAALEAPPPEPLPPVESLTPESDFKPFLKPGVDEGVKRQALRALFRDPQFNVQDGLDIYIGDYTQPDPIPPEMLARLNQMSHLGVREPELERDPAQAKEGLEAAAAASPEAVEAAELPAAPEPAAPAAEPAAEPAVEHLHKSENPSR